MKYKKLYELNPECRFIRMQVFGKEQGFQEEFDQIDDTAVHLCFYDGKMPFATCRYYKGITDGEYIIGRVAVLRSHRGRHLGSDIMKIAEQEIFAEGGKKISLSAQLSAKVFYERNGYTAIGATYLDEYCPHIHMEKELFYSM